MIRAASFDHQNWKLHDRIMTHTVIELPPGLYGMCERLVKTMHASLLCLAVSV